MFETKKWEYKSYPYRGEAFFDNDNTTTNFEFHLNDFGKEGWELVSVFTISVGYENSAVAVFKRPLK